MTDFPFQPAKEQDFKDAVESHMAEIGVAFNNLNQASLDIARIQRTEGFTVSRSQGIQR